MAHILSAQVLHWFRNNQNLGRWAKIFPYVVAIVHIGGCASSLWTTGFPNWTLGLDSCTHRCLPDIGICLINIQPGGVEQNRRFLKAGLAQKGWDNPKHDWFLGSTCWTGKSLIHSPGGIEWRDGKGARSVLPVASRVRERHPPSPLHQSRPLLPAYPRTTNAAVWEISENKKTAYWGSCDINGLTCILSIGIYIKEKKDKMYVITALSTI